MNLLNPTLAPHQNKAKKVNHKSYLGKFLYQNPFPQPLTLGFFYREKMRAIYKISPDANMSSILEVGGGQGGLTALLYPNAQIINLDLDPQFAHAPCNQKQNVKFICGDATKLPFADELFDAVTMFDVLEHIPDDAAAIAEAIRVLKPNGYLLISTPDKSIWRFPYYSVFKPLCPSEESVMTEWGHVRRGYTLEDLRNLLPIPFQQHATFINGITVINHDIAFSRLPILCRFGLSCLLTPLTWLGYWFHKPHHLGTEIASRWQKTTTAPSM